MQTVQLSKRDAGDKAAQAECAEQRAAELTAAALAPKDQLIRSLEQSVAQLEITLAQRTEVSASTTTAVMFSDKKVKDFSVNRLETCP